jgi:quinol monooxygenase YgiN
MTVLTLVANIKANTGHADLVKAELLKLIHSTRVEEGCINYDLHVNNENPNHFVFHETWETRELWQKHMNAPHIVAYGAAVVGAVESWTLDELTLIA